MATFVDSIEKLDFLREQCALDISASTPWAGSHRGSITQNILEAHYKLQNLKPAKDEHDRHVDRLEQRIRERWRRKEVRSAQERQIDLWEAEAICELIYRNKGVEMKPSELSDLPFDKFKQRFIVRVRGDELPADSFDPLQFLRARAQEAGRLRVATIVFKLPAPAPSGRLRMYAASHNLKGPIKPSARELTANAEIGVRFEALSEFLEERNLTIEDGVGPHFSAFTAFDKSFEIGETSYHGFWMSPGSLRPTTQLLSGEATENLLIGGDGDALRVPAELVGHSGLICGILSEKPLLRQEEVESILLEPYLTQEQLNTVAMRLSASDDIGHWTLGGFDFEVKG